MNANPFIKSDFRSYREWEEALAFFLTDQLRVPSLPAWLDLVENEEVRENAAQLSLFLANWAMTMNANSEAALREVFPALMFGRKARLDEMRDWISRKWVDLDRLRNTLQYMMDNNISSGTHHLVA